MAERETRQQEAAKISKKKRREQRMMRQRRKYKEVEPSTAPQEYICPLTLRVFQDPMKTPHGYHFERKAIHEYIKDYGPKCPKTGAPLAVVDLVLDKELQRKIDKFVKTVVSTSKDDNTAGGTKTNDNVEIVEGKADDKERALENMKTCTQTAFQNEDDLYEF